MHWNKNMFNYMIRYHKWMWNVRCALVQSQLNLILFIKRYSGTVPMFDIAGTIIKEQPGAVIAIRIILNFYEFS